MIFDIIQYIKVEIKMNEEIISTLLEWNPWLKDVVPQSLVGISRKYHVVSYLSIPEIKIVAGVRRSGKSTLLYQIIQHAITNDKMALYVNFEDETLQRYSLSDIYDAFLEVDSIDYLLVDEIQQCKDWVPFVRKCYDRKQLEQIWITGSNSSLIAKEYANLLTGRNVKITISTLSFSEFLKFKNFENSQPLLTKQQTSQVKKLFQEYLGTGAFPAIALRNVFQRELLVNYFEDFLYKDIASRYEVNTTKLKDLAIFLATQSSQLFSYRNIANTLGLHPTTVNDYISYMKEVFLFSEIHKFDYSLKKQHSHDKKIYMVDTGLANSVSFRFSEDKGKILETAVYHHLKRQYNEIYFHRDKKECDFLVKQDLKITHAIQVTTTLSDPKTAEREFAGLSEAIRAYQPEHAMILTSDESNAGPVAPPTPGGIIPARSSCSFPFSVNELSRTIP